MILNKRTDAILILDKLKTKVKYFKLRYLLPPVSSKFISVKRHYITLTLLTQMFFLESLTNYYHIADIVVLPSTSESFGKILIEAGAAGVACVATATTGAKEIISSSILPRLRDGIAADRQDKKTGFLVPINNQKQMIEKIVVLLRDEDLSQKMGENAKKFIKKNFDKGVIIKKIINFWQEVCSEQ